jgi:hypothetical protein
MKNLKSLGLATSITATLMVLAGSATATSITTTTGGTAATPTIHMVNEGGHLKLANSIWNLECGSTVEGKVESTASGFLPKDSSLRSLGLAAQTAGT